MNPIKKKFEKLIKAYEKKHHTARVLRVNIGNILPGHKILTPGGVAIFVGWKRETWSYDTPITHAIVHFEGDDRRHTHTYAKNRIHQMAIYHEFSEQLVMLSSKSYEFVKVMDVIDYNITKRKFALLTRENRLRIKKSNKNSKKWKRLKKAILDLR